nr:MAG TPA: hypothetical protein [Bacteriophage sp.]DAR53474.1 MAG TPA: hypothetical protein [Caudoviricetes sp.]
MYTDYIFSPSPLLSSTSRLLGIGACLQSYTATLITVSRYTLPISRVGTVLILGHRISST